MACIWSKFPRGTDILIEGDDEDTILSLSRNEEPFIDSRAVPVRGKGSPVQKAIRKTSLGPWVTEENLMKASPGPAFPIRTEPLFQPIHGSNQRDLQDSLGAFFLLRIPSVPKGRIGPVQNHVLDRIRKCGGAKGKREVLAQFILQEGSHPLVQEYFVDGCALALRVDLPVPFLQDVRGHLRLFIPIRRGENSGKDPISLQRMDIHLDPKEILHGGVTQLPETLGDPFVPVRGSPGKREGVCVLVPYHALIGGSNPSFRGSTQLGRRV